ncbi:MAG: sulfotransferase family protein [Actinomycetota bacterium]
MVGECFPFLIGRGRSGTTLLRSIVDSHSQIAIPYESHFPVTMGLDRIQYENSDAFDVDRFLKHLGRNYGFRRWGIDVEEVNSVVRELLPEDLPSAIRLVYSAYARCQGKRRYGEKTPGFVTHIPLLSQMFAESRFVHVIRDGRNVALSYLAGGWGPKDVGEAAIYWRRFVEAGRRDGVALGEERYMELRYEELVDNPEPMVKRVCRFIDLSYEPQMLRYFDRGDVVPDRLREHLSRGHQNLRRPPTKGLRDWQQEMATEDIELFEAIAGDLLTELGYERTVSRFSMRARAAAAAAWLQVQHRRASRRIAKTRAAWSRP